MSYETWQTMSNTGALLCVIVPIVFAIWFYVQTRRPADKNDKRKGRPWLTIGAAIIAFFACVVAWGFALREPYPDYVARDNQASTPRVDMAGAIAGCADWYRSENRSVDWDAHFDVQQASVFNLANSTSDGFQKAAQQAAGRDMKLFLIWIPRRGENILMTDDGMAMHGERHRLCMMAVTAEGQWHNVGQGLVAMQREERMSDADQENQCLRACNARYTRDEYVSRQFYSCAARCRGQ